jgi:hypothetical protein
VLYVGAGPDDFAGAFVAQTVCCLDFEVSDATGVPEVDVGAEDDGVRSAIWSRICM